MRKLNRMVVALAILALLVATLGSSLVSAEQMTIVKFEGEIESQDGDMWTIGGKAVEVTDATLIFPEAGEAVVGAKVSVVASKMADESLVAVVIRVKGAPPEGARLHLAGFVDELDEDSMVVHGIEIGIAPETEIEGELAVGVFVLVQAQMTAESYVAERITVVDLAESPTFVVIGVIREMDGETWQIGPHSVVVTEDTVITGEPVVGAWAKAKVMRAEDGTLVALEILIGPMADWEPEMGEFEGEIETFSPWIVGRWVIGGQDVYVSPMTRVEGAPAVGAMALVKYMTLPNGHFVAKEIIIEGGDGQTHFIGEIEFFPAGHVGMWQIEGRDVLVNPSTEIEGEPAVGALATVSGYFNAMDEVFMATRIAVWGGGEPSEGAYYHVTGQIAELTDDYVRTGFGSLVSDETLYLTDDTVIEGELEVGKLVAIRGIPQDETCDMFFDACDIDATDIYVYEDDLSGAGTLATGTRPATSASLWAQDR